MLVLLSPAKSLDWAPTPLQMTQPRLGEDTAALRAVAKSLSPHDLSALMGISDKLAQLNHDRYQAMTGQPDLEQGRPAALAFNGDVYLGLDARSLTDDDLAWAQDHVAILSGLYGVLRPLDAIEPYRLEMGTRLQNPRGANLYQFWGDRVTRVLNAQLRDADRPTVLNLASNEYFKVVKAKALEADVITPVFHEEWDGKRKPVSFYAKRARGMMARFVVEERLTDPVAVQRFSAGGYRYRPEWSDERKWVFSRPKPPPARG